ncbi:MAG: carbon storage regulator [Defluviitaleaceae bacterium]|nr:carbon storage regulator [Defluviitaleaceae bacterium]
MLHLTLSKGEHLIIGENIKLTYSRNDGKAVASLSIGAPREIKIVRGKIFEERIAEKASSGDREAMQLLEKIIEENIERRRIFNKRKSKRRFIAAQKKRAAQIT